MVQAYLGFMYQVAMMLPLDDSLKAERDEEADGDGKQMQQEIAPAMDWLMGRMNIEHGNYLVRLHRASVTNC